MVVIGLYISSLRQEQNTLQGAHEELLPDYFSEVYSDILAFIMLVTGGDLQTRDYSIVISLGSEVMMETKYSYVLTF